MCSELIVRSEQITRTVTESLHLQISIVNSICDRCIIVLEKINRFFIHRSVGNNFLQLHTTSQESYSTKLVCRVDPIAFFFDFFEIRSCFWDREFITDGAGMMSDVNFASAATVDMIIIIFFFCSSFIGDIVVEGYCLEIYFEAVSLLEFDRFVM